MSLTLKGNKNIMTKNTYIKLSTGDLLSKNLIGACSHYIDHGVMILNTDGLKLLWLSEPSNEKAKSLRDEVVTALMA